MATCGGGMADTAGLGRGSMPAPFAMCPGPAAAVPGPTGVMLAFPSGSGALFLPAKGRGHCVNVTAWRAPGHGTAAQGPTIPRVSSPSAAN